MRTPYLGTPSGTVQITPITSFRQSSKFNLDEILYFLITKIMKMKTTDPLNLEIAASSFAALGSEQRLTVLRVLVRAGPAGLSIGVSGTRSGITSSTLTHHMKILSSARSVA